MCCIRFSILLLRHVGPSSSDLQPVQELELLCREAAMYGLRELLDTAGSGTVTTVRCIQISLERSRLILAACRWAILPVTVFCVVHLAPVSLPLAPQLSHKAAIGLATAVVCANRMPARLSQTCHGSRFCRGLEGH